MKPKLVILLDAFGEEYYNKSNYLKELGTKKYSLETMFGYQAGYDAFLSGRYPCSSNTWFNFIIKEKGLYGDIKSIVPIIKSIRTLYPGLINSGIPFLYSKIFNITSLYKIPQCLPMNFLHRVDLLNRKHPTNKKYHDYNIFSYLRDKGIPYKFIIRNTVFDKNGYKIFYWKKGSDEIAKNIFIENLDKYTQFYFIHLVELDVAGHEYLFDSRINEIISKEENIIKEIIENFLKLFPDGDFIIFGDHGMAPVTNYVNPYDIINCIEGIDKELCYIIDSTFLRIYLSNEKNKDNIVEQLKNDFKEDVIFVDDVISQKYNVPRDKKYGDIMISVKPYELFYPNFFNDHHIKGMHGYTPDIPEAPGKIISNIEIEKEFLTIPEFHLMMRRL